MGTSDIGFREIGNLEKLESLRKEKQLLVDEAKRLEERRRYGQFSTPFLLAKEMVSYGLSLLKENSISFLEPSLGTGVFYSALLSEIRKENKNIKILTGVEIDPEYFDSAKSIWSDKITRLYNEDFTHLMQDGKYNLLITNPPYVRHHYIPDEEKIYLKERVKKETGIQISGLAGLYSYFILLSHKWLAKNAICGWLIPSEFMDVNYGKAIKQYLLEKVHLLRIHRYDPENSKFDDALVSSCVVWFKNEEVDGDYDIEFSYGGSHDAPLLSKHVKKTCLLSENKWTRFPEKDSRKEKKEEKTLGDYFTIKRGIATGDNNFFILEKQKIHELGLDMNFFKPVLPSPRYLKTDYIETDYEGNPKLTPSYFILDCELTENEVYEKSPALWTYLQSGIPTVSTKYLCKNRKTWYWQEKRQPTLFLCSYMGRGDRKGSPIRFILNKSNAIVTNSYLMLYPKDCLKEIIDKNPQVIFQIWEELKNINSEEIEDEGRFYGGGLKKIEPKELTKVVCGNLTEICNHYSSKLT